MDNILAISEIIKRYIKMRGYTIQQVADKLGVNYKTFVGILNRDAIDAKLLFSIANLLDIDLCWMSQLYEKHRSISFLEQFQMTRMNKEMKEVESKIVLACLDRHIMENPDSISDIKLKILKDFNQLFYLLDVLLPDSYIIRVVVEREKEKYYCMSEDSSDKISRFNKGISSITQFYEGHEMLKKIIFDRKEALRI